MYWTGGLIEIVHKLVPMHELCILIVKGIYKCEKTVTLLVYEICSAISKLMLMLCRSV